MTSDNGSGRVVKPDDEAALAYIEVAELAQMPLEQIEEIWDHVPIEDRDYLERRYRHHVKASQVGNDEQEIALAKGLLERYTLEGFVPAGKQWVRISRVKQLELKRGETALAEAHEDDAEGLPWLSLIGIGLCLFLLIFVVARFFGGRSQQEAAAIFVTPTSTATPTATPTATLVPSVTPTPTVTPIAFMQSDQLIAAGDRQQNRDFFPVQFQIIRPDDTPRVFIVQERLVELTEWAFAANPDVASWLSHTTIRPVLGIPYSAANDALLRSLEPDTSFVLRMNTGRELAFTFLSAADVSREDTRLLQQNEPGLVVVLVGQGDEDEQPTANRYIVEAAYHPAGEPALAEYQGLPGSMNDTLVLPDLFVVVNSFYPVPVAAENDSAFTYAVIDISLTAGETDISLAGYEWFLESGETRYTAALELPPGTNHDPLPASLSAGERIQASVAFLVSPFTGEGVVVLVPPDRQPAHILVDYQVVPASPSIAGLDVQLKRIWRDDSHVYAEIRLYNPQAGPVTLDVADTGLIFGFTANPTGPTRQPLEFEPVVIEEGAVLDLTLTFAWNGDDPFARLTLAERVWSMTLVEDG